MLEICYHNKRNFRFVDPNTVEPKNNIFTILVGKNGTGKSRLLSAIIEEFFSKSKTNFIDSAIFLRNKNDTISNRVVAREYTA